MWGYSGISSTEPPHLKLERRSTCLSVPFSEALGPRGPRQTSPRSGPGVRPQRTGIVGLFFSGVGLNNRCREDPSAASSDLVTHLASALRPCPERPQRFV